MTHTYNINIRTMRHKNKNDGYNLYIVRHTAPKHCALHIMQMHNIIYFQVHGARQDIVVQRVVNAVAVCEMSIKMTNFWSTRDTMQTLMLNDTCD